MDNADGRDARKILPIELRDLLWALAASQHRSLRQAAAKLQVRQSTLSRRLRDLEHSLGAELFVRTSGGTRPTAIGQEFIETAVHIIENVDLACARIRSHRSGDSGLLRIGVCTSFATGNLWATLAEHRRRFPKVDLRIVDGSADRLLSELRINELDVVIATGSAWHEGWSDRTLPLWSERVIVALPIQHPLSERRVVQWRELRSERILVPLADAVPDFELLLATKLRGGRSLRMQRQAAALDRLLSLVSIGYGALIMLEGATGASYKGVVYREVIDWDGPTRLDFGACWCDANSNPALRLFLDMLRERYPDLSSTEDRD